MGKNNTECPTLYLLHILGKRWTVPVLENFTSARIGMQFNDLESSINGITPLRLSESLKELSGADIIKKEEMRKEGVMHTEYFLTEKGIQLQKFIHDAKVLGICIYGIDASCTNRKCGECELFNSPRGRHDVSQYQDRYLAAF